MATPLISRPGFPPLPNALAELDRLARYFPPGPVNHQLVDGNATRNRVLAEMDAHDWIHLACHAGPLPRARRGTGGARVRAVGQRPDDG